MTQTLTTEGRIRAAAVEHGWTVKRDEVGEVTFTKGRRYIDVVFSVRGVVTHAHTPTTAANKNRAAFVLAELAK